MTGDALEILDNLIGDDPELREQIAEERLNARVGQLIYDARIAAGLTQHQLAEKVGTRQPVIARLENADYEGHSLRMLHRIAQALGQEVEIRFVGRVARHKPPKAVRSRRAQGGITVEQAQAAGNRLLDKVPRGRPVEGDELPQKPSRSKPSQRRRKATS